MPLASLHATWDLRPTLANLKEQSPLPSSPLPRKCREIQSALLSHPFDFCLMSK